MSLHPQRPPSHLLDLPNDTRLIFHNFFSDANGWCTKKLQWGIQTNDILDGNIDAHRGEGEGGGGHLMYPYKDLQLLCIYGWKSSALPWMASCPALLSSIC